jgi:cyclopropane-fatty-acyl-phospholipid synthase
VADTSSESQIRTAPEAQSTWLSKSAAKIVGSDTEEVQFHYDISNDFFRLWQDPNQVYSCAYFERDDMTLEQAQMAKIDLSLGKLGLQPGMTLLDIGCGWGATIMRAVGFGKYDDYFKKTFNLMPDDGVMLLHTIIIPSDEEVRERKLPLKMSTVRFIKFILDEIYPGGRLPLAAQVEEHAAKAGFTVTRKQRLRPHYARTLDTWAANLESNKDEAIAVTSEAIYERFMKYLTGCADLFRNGYTDVCQFTCAKS